jgi:mandelate racemase
MSKANLTIRSVTARAVDAPISRPVKNAFGVIRSAPPTAHWLEVLDLGRAILAEPVQIVDGMVTARGPGLGLSWDEAAVAKYLV